jgi:hypothetical protein
MAKSTIEETLMKHLSSSNMDHSKLKSYSAHLSTLKTDELTIERIWWIGIPFADELNIQFRFPLTNPGLASNLISQEITSAYITSHGIPNPLAFEAVVKFQGVGPVEQVGNVGA